MPMNEHDVRGEPTAAVEADQTISIGDVTFSIARLALIASDTKVTVVVGEMTVPGDADGTPAAQLVGIGTAVRADGAQVDEATVHIDFVRHDYAEWRSTPDGDAWSPGSSRRRRKPHEGDI